jgi:phosphate-selective porin OprO and OprP
MCLQKIFYSWVRCVVCFVSIIVLLTAQGDCAETDKSSPGIYIKVPSMSEPSQFFLGGLLQSQYRYYTDDDREDNGFDIRRAQVELTGLFTEWIKFDIKGEFKNNTSNHLLDAYGEVSYQNHFVRLGQYKKPFSLEQLTEESALCFAERSMGYYLSPHRGAGIGYKGMFTPYLFCSAGLFNTEEDPSTTSGNEHDSPEAVGRILFKPFAGINDQSLGMLQFGGSASYASLNLSDMEFSVKSTGMFDTNLNVYVLTHDTKFGVLQDVDDRYRYGFESSWSLQPLLFQAEYVHLTYTSLKPAGGPSKDAVFSTWYVSAIYWLTGESTEFDISTPLPVKPLHPFNPGNSCFGAFGLAARFDHFNGDDDWINPDAYVSVRDADGTSLAFNWVLFPMHRIILDYTHTEFSDPIRVRVKPDGSIDYIDKENVITVRYTIDF